jgi:hypothetical protein
MAKIKLSDIVARLVEVDSNKSFWAKETKLLKQLIKEYPDNDFWLKVGFGAKLKSFAQLMTWPMDEELRSRFRNFHFKVRELPEETKLFKKKYGKDKKTTPKQTLRNFIDG